MSGVSIDFTAISQQLKIRPEILKKLIKSFSGTLLEKMTALESALAKNDAMQMRMILHEIKGTAGNLRLSTITEAENVMHEAVKAGEGPDKLEGYFKTLKARVEELQKYLSEEGI